MLAQGDFARLLLAPTEERKKIFQKIFQTFKYQRLQEELKAEAAKLQSAYDLSTLSVKQYLRGIACAEDSPFVSSAQAAARGELPFDEVKNLISSLISADERVENEVQSAMKVCDKRLNEINIGLAGCARRKELELQFGRLNKLLAEQQVKFSECKARLDGHADDDGIIKKLTEEIAAVTALIPRYDELEAKIDGAAKAKAKAEQLKAVLLRAALETEQVRKRAAELEAERESLKAAELETVKDEAEFKRLKAQSDELKGLLDDADRLGDEYRQYAFACGQYENAREAAQKARAVYEEKNRLFLDAQAGVMAAELKDGEPCPVCGSVHHPSPAKTAEHAPSAAELDNLKRVYERAADEERKQSERAGQLKGAYEARAEHIKSGAAKYVEIAAEAKLKDVINAITAAYSGVNDCLS
ncbi:MAG: hypothetical protein K2J54_04530, partial [Clostridia bacterium]|nr:hypothetical protein [Clostridia bacterium]